MRLAEEDVESEQERIAIILESNFKNGIIKAEIAESQCVNAPDFARGFVGIAFHVARDGAYFSKLKVTPSEE